MSTVKETGFAKVSNGKTESFNAHTGITGQEPTSITATAPRITPPRFNVSWLNGSSAKHSKSPNRKEVSVPNIVIWPDTPVVDTIAIDIADPLQPSSPHASTSPSTPLTPPPSPRSVTGFEHLNSSTQCEIEDVKKHLQNGFNGREEKDEEKMRLLERNENDIKTESGENASLSMNGETSKNDGSKPDDGDEEEEVSEEKKRRVSSRRAHLPRRSGSPVDTNRLEKETPVSILHHTKSDSLMMGSAVATNTGANLSADHPTMGQSLNNLASQTFHDNQRITKEKTSLGAGLLLNEPKKRRSFYDLLSEIPRMVSEADLGNVAPILKRSLANRKTRKPSQETAKEKKEVETDTSIKDCFFVILSGLYGLIIVVLGAVIPISETFAESETPNFFDAFYIYMFTCSGLFILYVYTFLLRHNKKSAIFKTALNRTWSRTFSRSWSFTSRSDKENAHRSDSFYRRKITTDLAPHNPNGSFYLRLGAVGFGIGGMIHSGLQLGIHFQGIGGNSQCDSRIQAVKPLFHLIFTFSQLYFVFLNPKVCIHRYKTFARFGLMHMCGTNICVWFRNIVVETLHEMHHGGSSENHGNDHHSDDHHLLSDGHGFKNVSYNVSHAYGNMLAENNTHKPIPDLSPHEVKCYWNEMMGKVVDRAAPYLYPCSIEYSLICAGIMYVLWSQVGRGPKPILVRINRKNEEKEKEALDHMRNNRMSVDCGSSSRGLFVGILLFVGAVITMVAFYVLGNKENMTIKALTLVHLTEITIYFLGMFATLAASWRMRSLAYHPGHASVLENVLILISLTGVLIFCIFGIIAAIFHKESGLANALSIASNLMMIIQSIIQTVFMVGASELQAVTPEDVNKKQGREFVTFLILCNLSLWGINTFETQRSEHNPVQTDFYGHMAWAILTHISVPLGIFYRFHSTVCLSNIWKNAWKNKKH